MKTTTRTLIVTRFVPAHFNCNSNSAIPACWLAWVEDGREDEVGVQSRWHDRQGAIDGVLSELCKSSRENVVIEDANCD
jgi:hypothetical protein